MSSKSLCYSSFCKISFSGVNKLKLGKTTPILSFIFLDLYIFIKFIYLHKKKIIYFYLIFLIFLIFKFIHLFLIFFDFLYLLELFFILFQYLTLIIFLGYLLTNPVFNILSNHDQLIHSTIFTFLKIFLIFSYIFLSILKLLQISNLKIYLKN